MGVEVGGWGLGVGLGVELGVALGWVVSEKSDAFSRTPDFLVAPGFGFPKRGSPRCKFS